MGGQLLDHAAKQETQEATKIWTKGSTIAGTIKSSVVSGWNSGYSARSGQDVPKEQQQGKIRTIRRKKSSGVKQKGQQKVAGGNTKSIHKNPITKDDII